MLSRGFLLTVVMSGSYTGEVSTTNRDQDDQQLVLTGPLARWLTERAEAEGAE